MKNDMALNRLTSNLTKLVIRARESPILLQNKIIDTKSVFLDAFIENHESGIGIEYTASVEDRRITL